MLVLDNIISDRGSKYAVSGASCASETEAKNLLKSLKKRKKFAKATHNSWGVLTEAGPLKSDDGEAGAVEPPSAEAPVKPTSKYKPLKKRMKSSFKEIGESLAAQKLPEPDILDGFLADSERMMAFAGKKYGEADYPAYRQACRQFAEAYEARDWAAFKDGYTRLEQLKKDCHKAYK